MQIEQNEVAIFVKLVEQFAGLWYAGEIPTGAEREKFVQRILADYLPETDRRLTGQFDVSEWFAYIGECETKIREAVEATSRHKASRFRN